MFNVKPEERFSEWRKFRKSLTGTTKDQITRVVNFWSKAPIGSRYIDYYTPTEWPTPWEILHDSLFCKNTIAVMMYYTLLYSDYYDEEDLEILLINDKLCQDIFLIVLVDDFVLNYNHNQLNTYTEIQNNIEIIERYNFNDINNK